MRVGTTPPSANIRHPSPKLASHWEMLRSRWRLGFSVSQRPKTFTQYATKNCEQNSDRQWEPTVW